MGEYRVICSKCGHLQDPYALACSQDDSLLRTEYSERRLVLQPLPGIWRFLDWLPVTGALQEVSSGPMTYKSEGLSREIGLKELYITFNGYWPERRADMLTCSFKELEALPTMRRMRERGSKEAIVVASAGNTGRAFAYVSSLVGAKAVIVIPTSSQDRIWIPDIERKGVLVIAVEGDYYDAIRVADALAGHPGFVPEGGARNVARRDGMGTVMLDATLAQGALPRHYFQAVGSGTGGISAYEASIRLLADGRFGTVLPILHLAQSIPCAPLYHARVGGNYPISCPKGVYDDVLFNRRPPYGVQGGVGEALDATSGEVVGVTNGEAEEAKKLFEGSEDIDILPAPAVAVAALLKAVDDGRVGALDRCVLNITGGGMARLGEEHIINQVKKDLVIAPDQGSEELLGQIRELLVIA